MPSHILAIDQGTTSSRAIISAPQEDNRKESSDSKKFSDFSGLVYNFIFISFPLRNTFLLIMIHKAYNLKKQST